MLTPRVSETSIVLVFLSKRHSEVMSDTVIDSIKSRAVSLHLVYKGVESASIFETQECLVKNNIARHAVSVTHFTPARPDHLGFVNRLLNVFCALDICCALVGTYAAFIAGVHRSHYVDHLRLGQLCIARTDSPIIDNIRRWVYKFPA